MNYMFEIFAMLFQFAIYAGVFWVLTAMAYPWVDLFLKKYSKWVKRITKE